MPVPRRPQSGRCLWEAGGAATPGCALCLGDFYVPGPEIHFDLKSLRSHVGWGRLPRLRQPRGGLIQSPCSEKPTSSRRPMDLTLEIKLRETSYTGRSFGHLSQQTRTCGDAHGGPPLCLCLRRRPLRELLALQTPTPPRSASSPPGNRSCLLHGGNSAAGESHLRQKRKRLSRAVQR